MEIIGVMTYNVLHVFNGRAMWCAFNNIVSASNLSEALMQRHEMTIGELRELIKDVPDEFKLTQMEWNSCDDKMEEVSITDLFICEPDKTVTVHVF
jgi:hypothetical protein